MLPKIGICICFTLCRILLYCSWRISEITSAVPCKAVLRNSLTYTCSLWRTPCTKKKPLCMHMTSKRWCTGHSSAGGGKHDRIFPAPYAQNPSTWDRWCGLGTLACILCKAPAEISWLPGAPTPPALQPFPSSQPTRSWLSNTSARSVPPHVPCSSTALISHNSCLHFKWYQVSLLAQLPRPSACNVRCFQTSASELDISQSSTRADWHGISGAQILCLKVNAYFRAFLKLYKYCFLLHWLELSSRQPL